MGGSPLGSLPGLSLGSNGDLGGSQTPCLTRNETPVTALVILVFPIVMMSQFKIYNIILTCTEISDLLLFDSLVVYLVSVMSNKYNYSGCLSSQN
jgi:hypothetical protein